MSKTIEDIARQAGVSKTTVSMVINGRGSEYRISQQTQRKILDIVKEENYTLDQYARGFRLQKTQTIGLVVPDLTNLFFSQISYETEYFARKFNHQVLVACTDDHEETEYEVIKNLHARRVDGLIVASVMKKDKITKDVLNLKIPVVYIDRRIESDNVSWVASNNYQGAFDLINHICSSGIREIYYLGGLKNISTSINRLKGYQDALEKNGIRFESERVFQKDYTIASGYELAKEMFEHRNGMPEAFFTAALTLLEGSLRFIQEKIGEIPAETKIVTYDDHPFLDYLSVKISSVRQDTQNIARTAFEMIYDMLSGKQIVQHKIIAPKMIIRS
jgi:LacI family sucrose operon transcriptional repressor